MGYDTFKRQMLYIHDKSKAYEIRVEFDDNHTNSDGSIEATQRVEYQQGKQIVMYSHHVMFDNLKEKDVHSEEMVNTLEKILRTCTLKTAERQTTFPF